MSLLLSQQPPPPAAKNAPISSQRLPKPEVDSYQNSFESNSLARGAHKSSNSSSNETVICLRTEQQDAASEQPQENHETNQAPEVSDSEKTAGESEQKQQRKFFKSFLLFTSYLNPFNQPQQPAGACRKRSSVDIPGASEPNGSQRSSFHLNLLNFAQRYFGSSRNNSSSELYYSKSAPNTPLKSPVIPNGLASVVRDVEEAAMTGSSAPSVRHSGKPSVRFLEATDSTENPNGSKLRYTDCASQTTDVDRIRVDIEEDEYEEDNLDGLSVVAKLFRLPPGNEPQTGECPMDSERFRQHGYSLIDYISNYLDTINKRRVTPLNIEPGYLKSLIQASAPERGESFSKIMQDFESHIMCGITHWQHPHFHAYFPAGNAYPSILADMLSDALGCVGFSWAASPAYTELEIIMLNWMGKMIGLPDEFLCLSGQEESAASGSRGGGVIQGSASECVLVNLLAARHWAIERLRKKYPEVRDDGQLLSKLIGYCSKEAHSCVEKAAMIGFIRMRALETDEKHSLRGETLDRAIREDIAQGLEPFFVCATLGTTSCVSFDNIDELGAVCGSFLENQIDIWLHVDAAYAGSALICPEFKYLIKGIERASSLNMNPNKWMLINFDCSLMWVRDRFKLTRAFVVDPLYLQHSYSDQAIDYRHWGIPLSRRFRALKLWFVIRNYGLQGLQAYIRLHVRLAKLFETLILSDTRFSIMNQVVLGLVCFRLQGSNALNQRLLSMINASGKLHMVPASLNGRYVIRFCVCDQNAKDEDIHYAYKCISDFATELLDSIKTGRERIRAISQQNTIDVSSVSIHTQQSVSADQLESNNARRFSDDQSREAPKLASPQQVAAGGDQTAGAGAVSPREAARKYMLSSSSRSNRLENSQRDSPTGDDEQLEQDCQMLAQEAMGAETLEDLLDDDLDDELLAEPPVFPGELGDELPLAGSGCSLENSAASSGPASGNGRSEHEEAADEVFNLTRRRNRMSLRYKREFFVRVVSDPRVYRASISGDINARASSSSLSGSGQQQLNNSLNSTTTPTTSSAKDQPA